MELDTIVKTSVGIGIMLNTFGLNRVVAQTNFDKCSRINIHLGLSAFFLAGALKTYKAIRC
jgi:hypothetical protein